MSLNSYFKQKWLEKLLWADGKGCSNQGQFYLGGPLQSQLLFQTGLTGLVRCLESIGRKWFYYQKKKIPWLSYLLPFSLFPCHGNIYRWVITRHSDIVWGFFLNEIEKGNFYFTFSIPKCKFNVYLFMLKKNFPSFFHFFFLSVAL